MNKDDFESKFQSGSAAGAAWAHAHGKLTLGIACFVLGWIIGKFI